MTLSISGTRLRRIVIMRAISPASQSRRYRAIDRRGPRIDRRLHTRGQKIELGARGILGGPFHIVGIFPRQCHRLPRRADDFFRRHPQLVFHVKIRRRNKNMDPLALRRSQRLPARSTSICVGRARPAMIGVSSAAEAYRRSPGRFQNRLAGNRKPASITSTPTRSAPPPSPASLEFIEIRAIARRRAAWCRR